ncbi:four-domain proteases inhibitor-like [Dendronephthya gigantea]|uniref:four-domain proteases inhibitor-like n=1 Tax=Dendronephthya gigantea TaxID=151771 RepID=UPI00106ADAA3|nr:four-domain proteases inhibitor-like [Dendronephthya gigantea]
MNQLLIFLSLVVAGFAAMDDCPKICTLIYNPVCGSDGKTYPSPCNLKAKACAAGKKITIEHRGKCNDKAVDDCPKICPLIYSPVCGSDGKTYPSPCNLKASACAAGKKITIEHRGKCKDKVITPEKKCFKPCPRNYQPVCGSDGNTYSNTCVMEVEACLQDKDISVAYEGRCEDEKN